MEPQREKDPLEVWTRPIYREQIARCLKCQEKDCPGYCRKKNAENTGAKRSSGRNRGPYNLHINRMAVAKILHDWGMSIGEFSDLHGIGLDLVYKALQGRSLSYESIQRLAEALDTYPKEIMKERVSV